MSDAAADLTPVKRALLEIRQLRARLDGVQAAAREPIAVIGLGCRFPGAGDPRAFWQLLREGRDAVGEIPPDRWDVDSFYSPDLEAPGKMYVRQGAFLSALDQFDPAFFGIAPREAQTLDPQQRLLLEVLWEALENAGQRADRLATSATGVFVGIMNSDYHHLQRRLGELGAIDTYTVTGSLFSVAAGRLSYVLGLHGPNLALDTACSSSLVAVHLACQSLRAGECNLALAGGVNVMLAPEPLIERCKARMLSPAGRCKTFDAGADGYVPGEGCGMVVLKLLSDARRDGDRIAAVIRGSAVNHDGPASGLTVPNGPAQQMLLRQALASAGVRAAEIGYVEAHGTGTALGDPIEVNALAAVLGEGRSAANRLAIGSVKTNIGHLESAAGIAGLIKAILVLEHRELPPHLHLRQPNPHIAWDELPVTVPLTLTPWRSDGLRLAGVSSFGVSGTNAHVILEEAPADAALNTGEERPCHLLTLSARTPEALRELARRHGEALSSPLAPSLADAAATANAGRVPFPHRWAAVGGSAAELAAALAGFAQGRPGEDVWRQGEVPRSAPRVAFLFTGQGSHEPGAGRALFAAEPVFRQRLERCADLLGPLLDRPLLDLLFPAPGSTSPLTETGYAQPALFAFEYALAELWRSWGVEPGAVLGHSVGELAAACVAGVLSLEDGLRLAAERGRLMQALPRGGAMAAVAAAEAAVAPMVAAAGGGAVAVAALNAPDETVVSGAAVAVAAVVAHCERLGHRCRPLAVSHAFHSPLIEPMLDDFAAAAARITYHPPLLPLVSPFDGQIATATELASAGYWRRQARATVRFADALRTLRGQGFDLLVEVGPQPTLTALGQRCFPAGDAIWLPSLRRGREDGRQMLESLASLWLRGVDVDWRGVDGGRSRRRVPLPTYPFQRQRFWFQTGTRTTVAAPAQNGTGHPLLGRRLSTPLAKALFESTLSLEAFPYLADHRVAGVPMLPAAAWLEMVLAAAPENVLEEVELETPLALGESRTVQLALDAAGSGFQIFSAPGTDSGTPWRRHARGRLATSAPAAIVSLAELRHRCPQAVETGAYYDRLLALGLDYGASFRTLAELWQGPTQALGDVRLPCDLADRGDAGAYRLHPALLDGCLQVLVAACEAGETTGGADDETVWVPVRIGRLSVFGAGAKRLWSHASRSVSPDGEVCGDLRLYSEDGVPYAEIAGLTLRRTPRRLLLPVRPVARWLYELDWPAVPAPAAGSAGPPSGDWLILGDRGGVGAALADRLTARGERCRLAPAGDLSPLAQLLASPLDQGVIYLGALDASGAEPPEAQEALCGGALRLIQGLAADGAPAARRLWLVTRGAQAIAPSELPDLAQTALWGLGRVAAREVPVHWGGLVDLDPAMDAPAAAAALLTELTQADGDDQVAWRAGRRHAARLVRRTAAAATRSQGPLCRADATYLITGGLGALGLETARFLAAQGARQLVLVGRSAPSPAALAALAELEAAGVRVDVEAADVAVAASLGAVIARIDAELPPLAGVVHAAGVLDDGVLMQLDWPRFARVLAPKVAGAWNLHRLTAGRPLELFVLFSSMASLLGTAGQANYAAGNAFLDGLAQARRAAGLPALVVNWGPWSEAGMAASLGERERRRLAQQGISELEPAEGIRILEEALRSGTTQLAALPVEWDRYLRPLAPAVPSMLRELAGSAASPVPRREAADAASPAAPAQGAELAAWVRRQVAQVLGLGDPQRLDPQQNLFELGLDSLMALDIRNRLQSGLGRTLPSNLVFDHPSATALTGQLETGPAAAPPAAAPPARGGKLKDLTESQLRELLSERVTRLKRRELA